MKTNFTPTWSRTVTSLLFVSMLSTTAFLQTLSLSTIAPDFIMMNNPVALGLEAADEMIAAEFQRQEKFHTGLQYYNKGLWKQASTVLESYVDNYLFPAAEYEAALILKAKAQMNAGLYVKAFGSFDLYLSQDVEDVELRSQAEFYRSMMMLRINKKTGIAYLKIVSDDHANYYQGEASALYNTITTPF